jgi:hypothetical protein
LFSDRPNRIVATQSTQDFIGNWTAGQDSFQVDPPNAAIVVLTDDQEDDVFEIELSNPVYDQDKKSLRYDFSILGNVTSPSDLPDNLGKSVLVIDSSESEWPLQYSGNWEINFLTFRELQFFLMLLCLIKKYFHSPAIVGF